MQDQFRGRFERSLSPRSSPSSEIGAELSEPSTPGPRVELPPLADALVCNTGTGALGATTSSLVQPVETSINSAKSAALPIMVLFPGEFMENKCKRSFGGSQVLFFVWFPMVRYGSVTMTWVPVLPCSPWICSGPWMRMSARSSFRRMSARPLVISMPLEM